jgi:A/G-specific adenine glycosylase
MNQEALLAWYRRIQRPLPWRLEPSPWSILLSEILLQQTQMERGIVYHKNLLDRFPTIQSMAESSVDDVLHLWQGAGYYARARRLHALSIEVMQSHGGQLPEKYGELLTLPGIGPYTAAAVASIAFNQPVGTFDASWLVKQTAMSQHQKKCNHLQTNNWYVNHQAIGIKR